MISADKPDSLALGVLRRKRLACHPVGYAHRSLKVDARPHDPHGYARQSLSHGGIEQRLQAPVRGGYARALGHERIRVGMSVPRRGQNHYKHAYNDDPGSCARAAPSPRPS